MKQILKIRFYTYVETAEMLGVHPDTVKDWVQAGKIESVRLGKFSYISELELFNYLKLTHND